MKLTMTMLHYLTWKNTMSMFTANQIHKLHHAAHAALVKVDLQNISLLPFHFLHTSVPIFRTNDFLPLFSISTSMFQQVSSIASLDLPTEEQNWSTHFMFLASQLAVSQAWNTCNRTFAVHWARRKDHAPSMTMERFNLRCLTPFYYIYIESKHVEINVPLWI